MGTGFSKKEKRKFIYLYFTTASMKIDEVLEHDIKVLYLTQSVLGCLGKINRFSLGFVSLRGYNKLAVNLLVFANLA